MTTGFTLTDAGRGEFLVQAKDAAVSKWYADPSVLDQHPDTAPRPRKETTMATGIAASDLSDAVLLRELKHLHETRNETFRHGTDDALEEHTERTIELEREYLRRYPQREVDPRRTRDGARQRGPA